VWSSDAQPSASAGDPDAELVRRIGAGEEAAFRLLVAGHLPRLHALARRMLGSAAEADEITQETFLRAWRQARDWRPGRARFDTWLHRVALNLCRDRLRRRREVAMAEPPEQVDPATGADRRLEQEESVASVRAAIARLPPRQREAIMLHNYQELSNTETAAVLGISVEALESLLARARRSLRDSLRDSLGESLAGGVGGRAGGSHDA